MMSRPQPAAIELEQEATNSVWSIIERQLHPSEVNQVKHFVGNNLIRDNQVMHDEVASLTQMLVDFRMQTARLEAERPVLDTSEVHAACLQKELLLEQVHALLQDARAQARIYGRSLDKLIPCLAKKKFRTILNDKSDIGMAASHMSKTEAGSATPSTRPSSACDRSLCCSPQHHLINMPVLPIGSCLVVEDLEDIADSVRDALHEERVTLMQAIDEQWKFIEEEDVQYTEILRETKALNDKKHDNPRELSVEDLQQLIGALQDFVSTCVIKQDAVTPQPHVNDSGASVQPKKSGKSQVRHVQTSVAEAQTKKIAGCSQVRRVKALIAEKRKQAETCQGNTLPKQSQARATKRNAHRAPESVFALSASYSKETSMAFPCDPFFEDPFAT